jgi:septal ring factor EnvC (AmiA/AmiB activator)
MRLLNRFLFGFFTLCTVFLSQPSVAQKDKAQLEKEKSFIQSQIAEAEAILSETSTKRKSSIGQLNALKRQIYNHQKLIKTYSDEVAALNDRIREDSLVIAALNSDLNDLKREYTSMVYALSKSSGSFNRLSFMFASANLSQFYMRFKYMEQYSKARKNQVVLISAVKDEIAGEKTSLQATKAEKSSILEEQITKKEKLDGLKSQQTRVLASLKREEQQISTDIETKKKEITKLERIIAQLLEEELRKESVAESSSPSSGGDLSNVSDLFEKNKASLQWPVNTGFISGKFGTHPHPVLKRIKVPNDGVNIQTKENEQVRAVFDGEVKKIAIVPGEFKYVVLVKHGAYFTVYAKLKQVNVKMGQMVARNDIIGLVNTDADGISEVQFQVWKNTQKLDPERWLAKR